MNANSATKPRMMPIKNLAKNGPVGVLKPGCTTGDDHIRALTTAPRIKPTSIFLRSARRPNPGRRSTYRRGIVVQTTGTGSNTHPRRACLPAGGRVDGVRLGVSPRCHPKDPPSYRSVTADLRQVQELCTDEANGDTHGARQHPAGYDDSLSSNGTSKSESTSEIDACRRGGSLQ